MITVSPQLEAICPLPAPLPVFPVAIDPSRRKQQYVSPRSSRHPATSPGFSDCPARRRPRNGGGDPYPAADDRRRRAARPVAVSQHPARRIRPRTAGRHRGGNRCQRHRRAHDGEAVFRQPDRGLARRTLRVSPAGECRRQPHEAGGRRPRDRGENRRTPGRAQSL